MENFQEPIINKKMQELTTIANNIDKLKLSKKWTIIFTKMCCYRCWKQLNKKQQSQMINIADVDSNAIVQIIAEKFKKAGLDLIESIAVDIVDEKMRQKAVNVILEKGAINGKNDVLLLIAQSKYENKEG